MNWNYQTLLLWATIPSVHRQAITKIAYAPKVDYMTVYAASLIQHYTQCTINQAYIMLEYLFR